VGSPFDQLGKKIGLRALGPSGRTDAQHEIHANARQADLRHEPDPAREVERARLGLLGRLASVPCLIELFSSAPGEEAVIDCLGKLIAYRQERRRAAKPFVKPFLWIITAGHPTTAMFVLGATRVEGWPRGVYITSAAPPNAGQSRRPGPREPGGLCVGFIVASELPRERATILVRIMAGGTALRAAIADLATLSKGAHERGVATADVLELLRVIGRKSRKTKEEEELIMTMRDAFAELTEQGCLEEAGRNLLTVLRVRGIEVPDAARERILAQKDRERLEAWLEKAVVATSVHEVIDEPS